MVPNKGILKTQEEEKRTAPRSPLIYASAVTMTIITDYCSSAASRGSRVRGRASKVRKEKPKETEGGNGQGDVRCG